MKMGAFWRSVRARRGEKEPCGSAYRGPCRTASKVAQLAYLGIYRFHTLATPETDFRYYSPHDSNPLIHAIVFRSALADWLSGAILQPFGDLAEQARCKNRR